MQKRPPPESLPDVAGLADRSRLDEHLETLSLEYARTGKLQLVQVAKLSLLCTRVERAEEDVVYFKAMVDWYLRADKAGRLLSQVGVDPSGSIQTEGLE